LKETSPVREGSAINNFPFLGFKPTMSESAYLLKNRIIPLIDKIKKAPLRVLLNGLKPVLN
jgi:hypothetical protein